MRSNGLLAHSGPFLALPAPPGGRQPLRVQRGRALEFLEQHEALGFVIGRFERHLVFLEAFVESLVLPHLQPAIFVLIEPKAQARRTALPSCRQATDEALRL